MSHFKDTVHSKAPFNVRVVEFGCRNCGRRWSSASGNLEDYQKCKNCYTECYPVGSRIREPNKFGTENRQTLQGHNKELCGKCARLERSCMALGNESDNDTDDMNMYIKTIPQTRQSNSREHQQDRNRPVIESYSLKQWPELTTLAFRYLPKPYSPSSSSRVKLVSTSNDVTLTGITAAETLTNAIHSAREEIANELSDDSYTAEGHSEEEYENNYQQDVDTVKEIWDYEAFAFDGDENNNYNHCNNMFNRLDDNLDMSDDEEKESKENEIVAFDDNDDLNPNFCQGEQNYSSSQDKDVFFDGIDDMSSDDCLYKKQMNNRLLRRGRKHALQGRKNSLKLIVD